MSVREVRPGVWYVQVYDHRRPDGSRPRLPRKTVHGTERDARKAERKMLVERDENVATATSMTVAQYAKKFLANKKRENLAPRTYAHYERCVNLYLIPHIGATRLTAVNQQTLRDLFDDLATAGKDGGPLSGTTRAGIEMVIKMVFRRAHADHLIPWNPGDGIRKTPTDTREPLALSKKDAEAFLSAIEGTNIYLPALLMYVTGMRPQEVLGLQRDFVDLEAGRLHVAWAVTMDRNVARLKPPKSRRGDRWLQFDKDMAKLLRAHLATLDRYAKKFGPHWQNTGLVFPTVRFSRDDLMAGRIWTPTAFGHAWRKAVAGTKWQHVYPYVMRHTFITHLLAGEGLKRERLETVSRLAGHANSGITSAKYSHVLPGEVDGVVVATPRTRARSKRDASSDAAAS